MSRCPEVRKLWRAWITPEKRRERKSSEGKEKSVQIGVEGLAYEGIR